MAKLLVLLTLILSLTPLYGVAGETVYDENSSVAESLVVVKSAGVEPQLTSTHEDTQRAKVVAVINKSPIGSTAQTMRVYVDGSLLFEWKVSTGREQVEKAKSGRIYRTTTPIGYFRPTKLEEKHYSYTWKADMPHTVFFIGGIAIHGSTHVDQLGKRASGGCVRLAPAEAEIFYRLVKSVETTEIPQIGRNGKSILNMQGKPVSSPGRDVLIIVENHA